MQFSSLEFIFLYLPVCLLCYFLLPWKWRNPVLLLFSLLFYGWEQPLYVTVMLFTIAVDWLCGRGIGFFMVRGKNKQADRLMTLAVVLNLSLLAFFKYAGLFLDTLRSLPGLSSVPEWHVTLPIGISFYTFQSLSYVIDVRRGTVAAQKNPVVFGTYVTMFPQLIAGPIVRYADVENELLTGVRPDWSRVGNGVRRFICGLCKKFPDHIKNTGIGSRI